MDEASIIAERVASEQAVEAMLMQSALGTVPNQAVKPTTTKTAMTAFRNLIDRLRGASNGEQ